MCCGGCEYRGYNKVWIVTSPLHTSFWFTIYYSFILDHSITVPVPVFSRHMSMSGNSKQRNTRLFLLKKLVELEAGSGKSNLMGKFNIGRDDLESIILVLGSSSSLHSSQEFDDQNRNGKNVIGTTTDGHKEFSIKRDDHDKYVYLNRFGQRSKYHNSLSTIN